MSREDYSWTAVTYATALKRIVQGVISPAQNVAQRSVALNVAVIGDIATLRWKLKEATTN